MAVVDRIRDRGTRQAGSILRQLGTELRDARLAAGLSQRYVAEKAGLTQTRISRTERGLRPAVSVGELVIHAAVLGLRLSVRLYPEGSPVRDAGQLGLLHRFRGRVSRSFTWRTEVTFGGYGDLRAWDARLDGPGSIGVDAETRLHDIQALQRRCETKWRDSGVDRVILVVAGTRHNRSVLRDHREALRSTFPADTREVMAALTRGQLPASNGIVLS